MSGMRFRCRPWCRPQPVRSWLGPGLALPSASGCAQTTDEWLGRRSSVTEASSSNGNGPTKRLSRPSTRRFYRVQLAAPLQGCPRYPLMAGGLAPLSIVGKDGDRHGLFDTKLARPTAADESSGDRDRPSGMGHHDAMAGRSPRKRLGATVARLSGGSRGSAERSAARGFDRRPRRSSSSRSRTHRRPSGAMCVRDAYQVN
jgi:hypothetical protein